MSLVIERGRERERDRVNLFFIRMKKNAISFRMSSKAEKKGDPFLALILGVLRDLKAF